MTWAEHYREQAALYRREAHQWASHGFESKAKWCLDSAEVYDELAEEAEKRAELRSEPR